MTTFLGGVEAGGTKCVCVIASETGNIHTRIQIPTTTPQETLSKIISFFQDTAKGAQITLDGLGLAFFGPINLDRNSSNFGTILSTPKLTWRGFNVLEYFNHYFSIPIKLETDVNAAASAEHKWGAAKDLTDFVYITVGTGIGGGVFCNGALVRGTNHPEIGHMLISHDKSFDPFSGSCLYHKDCIEGLASGPAILARWGVSGEKLEETHTAWDMEAYYIAQLIHNLTLAYAPQRIILGGGVSKKPGLIEKTRSAFNVSINGYVECPHLERLEEYIVPPALGDDAGVMGAIAIFG